jgi:DNA-binding GntR family transcriptional regulator
MRAAERAYATVRQGILAGKYDQGSRLTEVELAHAVGVSRTPIREALRRLHAEGLVQFEPNHGAIVAQFQLQDAEEIFELRSVLEPIGARRAAERASAPQLAELRYLAEQQMQESTHRRRGHLARIAGLNDRFHRLIQTAAGSVRLTKVLAGVIEGPVILRTFDAFSPDELRRSADQHMELVQAFDSRDANWAHTAMTAHILAGRATYMRSQRP